MHVNDIIGNIYQFLSDLPENAIILEKCFIWDTFERIIRTVKPYYLNS